MKAFITILGLMVVLGIFPGVINLVLAVVCFYGIKKANTTLALCLSTWLCLANLIYMVINDMYDSVVVAIITLAVMVIFQFIYVINNQNDNDIN